MGMGLCLLARLHLLWGLAFWGVSLLARISTCWKVHLFGRLQLLVFMPFEALTFIGKMYIYTNFFKNGPLFRVVSNVSRMFHGKFQPFLEFTFF